MSKTVSIAPVKKSVTINATQERAFEVYTSGIDRWWPKSHHIGNAPLKKSILEPKVGGRWYSVHEDGSETTTGFVKVWEPPHRVVHGWDINGAWKPDSTIGSEVEVRFIAETPTRTRVELEHRNFERMGQEDGTKMRDAVGGDGGWTSILELFRKEAEG